MVKQWFQSSYAPVSAATSLRLQADLQKILIARNLFRSTNLHVGQATYYLECSSPERLQDFIIANGFTSCDKPTEEIILLLGAEQ